MQWSDITVQQFQQLTALQAEQEDPILTMIDMVGICFDMTLNQIDSLPVTELYALADQLAFLKDPPKWEPVRHVTINGTRYRFVYDVRQIHCARNMEVKQFGIGGVIENLHMMAASMVVPQKRSWLGCLGFRWRDDKYDAAKHEQYSADLRQAPITAIYGSALFFCELWKKLIPDIADYLVQAIPEDQRTKAHQYLIDSCRLLDGNFRPSKSLDLREYL